MKVDRLLINKLLDESKLWERVNPVGNVKDFDFFRNTNVDIELDYNGLFVCQRGTVGFSRYFLYNEITYVTSHDRVLLVCGENQNFYIRIKKD